MAVTGNDAAERYEEATAAYGAALERLARAYEADPDRRRDLLQEIHIALWRSLAGFDGRCSLRTWVYRVAHNTATSQVIRRRARAPTLVSLDELASMPGDDHRDADADRAHAMERILVLIQALALILMWFLPELRLGLAYLVVTAVFLMSYVRRRSAFLTVSPTMPAAQGLAFYRHLLERERDFRRDSTRWFTIGPALNISMLGLVYVTSSLFHGTVLELCGIAAILTTHVVVLTRVVQRLRAEARTFQLELDALGMSLHGGHA